VRPSGGGEDEKGISEDFLSDEELILQPDDLEVAIETRVGGRHDSDSEQEMQPDGDDQGHHANSKAAIARVRHVWDGCVRDTNAVQHMRPAASEDVASVLAGARASQQKDPYKKWQTREERSEASIQLRRGPSAETVEKWLAKTRCELNREQMEVVELVVRRVMEEEGMYAQEQRQMSPPLLHLMHGGPGVGKSHVIGKIKEFYEDIMQWTIGDEYNIAALQAVMAVNLGGETLHHVAGINPFMSLGDMEAGRATAEEVAHRFLRTRWLIIDEISMVSASLLAQVDTKLRDIMRQEGTYKCDTAGRVRSFGGLNVLFVGDFYQLDPPEGVSLAAVPRSLLTGDPLQVPHSSAPHGQELFWGKCDMSLGGITELTEPVRCKDDWYNAFLDECRQKSLTETNFNFLTGKPTTVPGSWLNSAVQCKSAKCASLVENWRRDVASGRSLKE